MADDFVAHPSIGDYSTIMVKHDIMCRKTDDTRLFAVDVAKRV